MGLIERLVRKRALGDAEMLVHVDITMSIAETLHREGAVQQDWRTDDADMRAWLEPFLYVAYSTKQVSNFRGDDSFGVWQAACGADPGPSDYKLVEEVAADRQGGTYSAQAWRREGQLPFPQTPAKGGSRKCRELEVAASNELLYRGLGRNGEDTRRRLQDARQILGELGTDDFAFQPTVRDAFNLTVATMAAMEDDALVPEILHLLGSEQ